MQTNELISAPFEGIMEPLAQPGRSTANCQLPTATATDFRGDSLRHLVPQDRLLVPGARRLVAGGVQPAA